MDSRCISPDDLPSPPANCTGWPWTFASLPLLPDTLPDGNPWPRITIVTPSFNQAQFLEETIRSVLMQGYPNLEYIVMDGGSTDGSVEIIQKYAPWLAFWLSKPDRGQAHAINQGFARATGEWLGWLNSDDCYAPAALYHLMTCGAATGATWVAGASIRFKNGVMRRPKRLQPLAGAFAPATLRRTQAFDQPACLWQARLFREAGPLDEDQHYVFDWLFFNRCALSARVAVSEATVACYRVHESHKTGVGGQQRWNEMLVVYEQHLTGVERTAFVRVRPWLGLILRLKRIERRYGRFGLYYGWRLILAIIYHLVINRSPALHADIVRQLELPYAVDSPEQVVTRGKTCDGTAAEALAAFPALDK
jgi:glycosyltransferase involved in cell wall biosynthesis